MSVDPSELSELSPLCDLRWPPGLPRQRALHEHLRGLILRGVLRAGARLPASRVLAPTLGVARNTVLHAYAQLQAEEEKLVRASSRLQAKVDAFRTRKETIKATYSAAEAQTRINEAFTGISEEMNDIGLAIQRAEDKTLQLQARASAVDELLASGALDDPTGTVRDDITRELDALAADSSIESELAAMKAQLTGGPAARPELQAAPEAPGHGEGQA